MITGSVVTFHTSKNDLQKVIDSFLGEELDRRLFVIDNSSDNRLSVICNDDRIHYIFNSKNIGFGAAHNVAFQLSYKLNVDYHITLNPDISFNPEIIDLRTIKPLDEETIFKSIRKTNRVVIVEDGWGNTSFGSHLSHLIQSNCFDHLDSEIIKVSGKDVPMPYAENLEKLALPSTNDIVDAIKKVTYR